MWLLCKKAIKGSDINGTCSSSLNLISITVPLKELCLEKVGKP